MRISIKHFKKNLDKINELDLGSTAKQSSVSIDFDSNDTFMDVQNKLSEAIGISTDFIKLYWPGNTVWKPNHKLSQYGQLIESLRSENPHFSRRLTFHIMYSEIEEDRRKKLEAAMKRLGVAKGSLSDRLGEHSSLTQADYDTIMKILSKSRKKKKKTKKKKTKKKKTKKKKTKRKKTKKKRTRCLVQCVTTLH